MRKCEFSLKKYHITTQCQPRRPQAYTTSGIKEVTGKAMKSE